MTFILRPYQSDAVSGVLTAWERERSVLLVLATGLGKTVCATEVLRRRQPTGRALFLAHRRELLHQARKKIEAVGMTCELEQAENRALAVSMAPSDVVVGSVQTLKGARLDRWPRDAFSTIVVDEAHHATAESYRRILGRFSKAKVLGLTATPDRSDEVAMAHVFDDVAANYGIREGIGDGYLVPIVAESLGNLDLSGVSSSDGDLNQAELDAEVGRDPVIFSMAGALADRTKGRSTLIFMPGVQSAHRLADVLAQLDGIGADQVASIDATTPDDERAAILSRFSSGDLRFLTNFGIATEGFDAPPVSCVAVARPTKSRSLMAQMVGRGLRTLPNTVDGLATAEERRMAIAASAKPNMLLLDLADRDRVDLVGPADVLAGEPLPEETRKEVRKAIEAKDGRPLEDILADAEKWGEAAERARAIERRRRRIKVLAKYCSSPLELERMSDAHTTLWETAVRTARKTKGPRSVLATPKQRALCERYGIQLPRSANVKQASAAIDTIVKSDLCSVRQARVLRTAGLPTDVSKRDASVLIDGLKRHAWTVPEAMRGWAEGRRIGE